MDVNFDSGFEEVHPVSISRDASGKSISILFDSSTTDSLAGIMTPGRFSTFLVVHTDATAVRAEYLAIIHGSRFPVTAFAPLPEPSSLALLAIAVAGIIIRQRGR